MYLVVKPHIPQAEEGNYVPQGRNNWCRGEGGGKLHRMIFPQDE